MTVMGKIPQDKLAWLQTIHEEAKVAAQTWPAMRSEVCAAQAALETNWGKKPIGGWNLWGMKSMKWVPGSVERITHEWDRDTKEYVKITAKFCAFPTLAEGCLAYGRLVNNSPSYRDARNCTDLEAYVRALGRVWATDPQYAQKVLWIIKEAGL